MKEWIHRTLITLIVISLLVSFGLLVYDFKGFSQVLIEVFTPPILYLMLVPAGMIIGFSLVYCLVWMCLTLILTVLHAFRKK